MERDWLIALRAPDLGGQQLIELVGALGGVSRLVAASPARLRQAGLKDESIAALRAPDDALLASDLAWLGGDGHHLVPFDHESYPALLRRIPSPPAALFVAGDPQVLWQPQIAIVGSRNPTAAGVDHARSFAAELTRLGLTVVSGLASGIDATAHEAALEAGGRTIAVTGTGLDLVYPASSRSLAGRIEIDGALVSEFPPGTGARRSHFPSRNRIISGLALGVVVVEAGLNSGSLITARLGAEQGREVFALPGSLHNPMARGCHRLIKQGARLVESTQDIMEELAPLAGELALQLKQRLQPSETLASPRGEAAEGLPEDADYARLWAALGFDPVTVDRLVERTGLQAREVSSMLLLLELKGLVEFQAGGLVCRRA